MLSSVALFRVIDLAFAGEKNADDLVNDLFPNKTARTALSVGA